MGIRNHTSFLLFLLFTFLLALLVLVLTLDLFIRSPTPSLSWAVWTQDLPWLVYAACGLDLGVATLFLFPVTLLLVVHSRNFCLGKTTNERFAKKALSSFSEEGTMFGEHTEFESGSFAGENNSSRYNSMVEEIGEEARKTSLRKRAAKKKGGCWVNCK